MYARPAIRAARVNRAQRSEPVRRPTTCSSGGSSTTSGAVPSPVAFETGPGCWRRGGPRRNRPAQRTANPGRGTRRGTRLGAGGRNPWKDFRGERRSNATHVSTTDPEALLARKGEGQAAKLSFAGHVLMENRNGLVVDVVLSQATGTAETEAALTMLERVPTARRITVGADKGYDTREFVATCRSFQITPHVAMKQRRSAWLREQAQALKPREEAALLRRGPQRPPRGGHAHLRGDSQAGAAYSESRPTRRMPSLRSAMAWLDSPGRGRRRGRRLNRPGVHLPAVARCCRRPSDRASAMGQRYLGLMRKHS